MRLYDRFFEAEFLERPNRFVMKLRMEGRDVAAYTPNTGSMAEYLVAGQKFFLVPQSGGKYRYKVVSTRYNDQFIFLDTIMVNRIVLDLLKEGRIPGFDDFSGIRREVSFRNSRFDFLMEKKGNPDRIIEVKSCTLSHAGTAMFPDAPTKRGQRHLEELEALAEEGYSCVTLYLISDYRSRRFIPNFHTDPLYGELFSKANHVTLMPLKVKFTDPVTLDPDSLQPVNVGWKELEENNRDGGAYLLVLENPATFEKKVGKLGMVRFEKGFYVYAGSAMKGLAARLARHKRKRKKTHWHLDYIIPEKMKIVKSFPIRRKDPVEQRIAGELLGICDDFVPKFGATDSSHESHLTFFRSNPLRRPDFFCILFSYRMLIR